MTDSVDDGVSDPELGLRRLSSGFSKHDPSHHVKVVCVAVEIYDQIMSKSQLQHGMQMLVLSANAFIN